MKKVMKIGMSVLLSAAVLGAVATANADVNVNQIPVQSTVLLPKAQAIKSFTLQIQAPAGKDQTTAPKTVNFTNADLKGHWTLMFYGFTNCPQLCPTTMAQLSAAYKKLADDKYNPMPQVVFVSIDPQRDTLDKTTKFAHAFSTDFIGARTDDMNVLHQMTHDMDAMFEKVPGTGKDRDKKGTYTITHTGDIAVIAPDGNLIGLMRLPHTDDQIVADYKSIVKAFK